jgi:eukaryotic-like serine/threonine-protein kinase
MLLADRAADDALSQRARCAGVRGEVDVKADGRVADTHERPAASQSPSPGATELRPGTRLGPYRIDALLGSGGMGVVYKARDTRLDRFVALKLLPPERVADADRERRFVQEAKAASALNHPHIVTVYDIHSAGDMPFIAMEYVEGRTLADLIGRRGLPIRELLRVAAQLADALAAAHARGIVHRDLKPGNVMVTAAGHVKVLDFGLAKLVETEAAEDRLTVTAAERLETTKGQIVGTPSYMSPEQALGNAVDARTDIFSLGSVLYEMATGQRAFAARNTIATLSALIDVDPPPAHTIRSDLPRDIERIIGLCLKKDPSRRFQHMVDVKVALEALKEELDSGKLTAITPVLRQRTGPWAVAALIVVVLAVGAVVWRWPSRPAGIDPPLLTQLTRDTGLTIDPAVSPDGKLLAYASDRRGQGNLDIWIRQVAGGEPLRLTDDPADDREPAFSPDGTAIVFSRAGGGIYIVSALGGPARLIASAGRRPRFSPDGTQVVYWSGNLHAYSAALSNRDECRAFVVPAAGGVPRRLRPDFAGVAYPEWAPDGRHVLFLGNRDETQPIDDALDWWVTPLDDGTAIATGVLNATRKAGLIGPSRVYPWALTPSAWAARDGTVIFSARAGDNRNLWRIRLSLQTWKVAGPPERLTSSSAIEESPSAIFVADGSRKVAFASLNEESDIWSLPFDAQAGRITGPLRQLTWSAGADEDADLSPDGRRMVWVSARTGHQELWLREFDTGEERALTAGRQDKLWPRFSPDGTMVAFGGLGDMKWRPHVVPVSGGAEELCEECGHGPITGWSPDGRYVIGNTVEQRLFLIELASRRRIEPLPPSAGAFCCGRYSPDGRWVLFSDTTAGERGVIALIDEGTFSPRSAWAVFDWIPRYWSPDGTMVYGLSPCGASECVTIQRVDPLTKRPQGRPVQLSDLRTLRRDAARREPGSPGRDQFLLTLTDRTSNIWMAEWRGNW